jgi:spore protease
VNNSHDLSNFSIRTDLIIDDKNIDLNEYNKITIYNNIVVSKLTINERNRDLIKKEEGNYITIEFNDITDRENSNNLCKVLTKQIEDILKVMNIKDEDECIIIGLGNSKSTPDSLGPKVLEKIIITRHLFELNKISPGFRKVSIFKPGVMGTTGLETADLIFSIVKKIKPKFIIAIDALASSSIERLNRTIQITDTGIHPGSGVGNQRKEISFKTLGIPVLAIGIPTVVESSTIVCDTINYLFKHISYTKDNFEISKLSFYHNNYKNKLENIKLNKDEEHKLLGLLGDLDSNEKHQLITEVLESLNYNLMVCPKEIDFLIDKLSVVIANSLNNSLHRQINLYE